MAGSNKRHSFLSTTAYMQVKLIMNNEYMTPLSSYCRCTLAYFYRIAIEQENISERRRVPSITCVAVSLSAAGTLEACVS